MNCNGNTSPIVNNNSNSYGCNNGCNPKKINVICKNILIPNDQRIIGVQSEENATKRIFILPKINEEGTDLSEKTFFIITKKSDDETNRLIVREENIIINENYIEITWVPTPLDLSINGKLYISIEASSENYRWETYANYFEVKETLLNDEYEIDKYLNLQEKTINPVTSEQTILPDYGYNGLSKVTIRNEGYLEWKPQLDWWNIDEILENDTENYPAKMAVVLRADNDDFIINKFNYMSQFAKIKYSDNTEYFPTVDDNSKIYIHKWNKIYDKECSLGYKTRYVIFYLNNTNFNISYKSIKDIFGDFSLYIKFKNVENLQSNSAFSISNMPFLECIDVGNITYSYTSLFGMFALLNLKKIKGNFYSNADTMDSYSVSYNYLPYMHVNDIKSFISIVSEPQRVKVDLNQSFIGDELDIKDFYRIDDLSLVTELHVILGITKIKAIDFKNVTRMNNGGCMYTVTNIDEIYNINIDNNWFSQAISLNHDTLLRIIDALYDYVTEGNEETHILVLGSINLEKLTDEEIAIGTEKGWTIS